MTCIILNQKITNIIKSDNIKIFIILYLNEMTKNKYILLIRHLTIMQNIIMILMREIDLFYQIQIYSDYA